MSADDNVQLTALADLFPDCVEEAKKATEPVIGAKYQVTDDRCFVGFDAYKQLIDSDVDVVLLATTPHYRPQHLQAAVAAGKHVFCEKPVAVDPVGVRSILATCEEAEKKGLSIVSGLCWRYHLGVRETIKRILDGAIGDIVAIHENYLTGTLWHRGHEPQWSEMEYQNRNWYYFTWLSGDHIVEQFVHSLDKSMWLMGDQPPKTLLRAGWSAGTRGSEVRQHLRPLCQLLRMGKRRQSRLPTRARWLSATGDVDDYIIGTKGTRSGAGEGRAGLDQWRTRVTKVKRSNMYDC